MTGSSPSTFGPVARRERIASVDVVRGFALWGVLLINMFNFGAWAPHWTGPGDQFAAWAAGFIFEHKSWTLFSFLFGFGFSLQMVRAEERGAPFLRVYTRRLLLLFGFGIVHSFFYGGDILGRYAILGFVLLLFRRLSSKRLLVLTALLLLIGPIQLTIPTWSDPETETALAQASTRVEDLELDQAWLRAIDRVPDMIRQRATLAWQLDRFRGRWEGTGSWPTWFAMFLLGLYAGKRRVFDERNRAFVRRVFVWGLPLGIVTWTILSVLPAEYATVWGRIGIELAFPVSRMALAMSYAAGLVLLMQYSRWQRILSPLGAMGRTALTVYVSHSIIFSTLFRGYGFGLAFRVGPAGIFGYAALIYAVELAICVWWMNRFEFGPLEWLWRTLTYWKLQPMRQGGDVIRPTSASPIA